jgi:hypothetical protein
MRFMLSVTNKPLTRTVIMLNAVMLSDLSSMSVILSVIMLNGIMLSVIMINVVESSIGLTILGQLSKQKKEPLAMVILPVRQEPTLMENDMFVALSLTYQEKTTVAQSYVQRWKLQPKKFLRHCPLDLGQIKGLRQKRLHRGHYNGLTT